MKKILIVGMNSYVGNSFVEYMKKKSSSDVVEITDSMEDRWKQKDFSSYDCIFHVAGIAHSDTKKLTSDEQERYYRINTDLAIEVAKKAKKEKVKQFIFMSTMVVYGDSAKIGVSKIITADTKVQPNNIYGISKLKAEIGISELSSDEFKICLVRPPLIYGKGCKGNYPVLEKWTLKLPIFPDIDNERSMIYIENFCEFIRLLISNEESGIFYPQNSEYVHTSDMVQKIAEANGKRVRSTRFFNPIIYMLSRKIAVINKVFGNMTYDKSLSKYKHSYALVDFNESIGRIYKKD